MQWSVGLFEIKFFWTSNFSLANQTEDVFSLLGNKILYKLFVVKHPAFIINLSFSTRHKIASNKNDMKSIKLLLFSTAKKSKLALATNKIT